MSRYIEVAHETPVLSVVLAAAENLTEGSMRKVAMADMTIVGAKLAREASVKLKAEDGQRARTDYNATVEARDVNMARLKALRLGQANVDAGVAAKAGKTARSR